LDCIGRWINQFVLEFTNARWQIPYLLVPSIASTRNGVAGIRWKILWWFYTLHDTWYAEAFPIAGTFEAGWMMAVLVGAMGLYRYYHYSCTSQRLQSLLLFCIAGALQSFTIVLYLCFSGWVNGFANAKASTWSFVIFLGLNAFRLLGPAMAAVHSGQLLLFLIQKSHRD